MQFKNVLFFSLLAGSALAAPTHAVEKRAIALQSFSQLSISNGTAGNAEAEANAKIANLPSDLSTVSASDLKNLQANRVTAEDAETSGFNPAIAAASGTAKTALQNGKIKNKVLKLTLEVAAIKIKAAQGGSSSSLAAEQKKLTNNINLDKAAAGQAATSF